MQAHRTTGTARRAVRAARATALACTFASMLGATAPATAGAPEGDGLSLSSSRVAGSGGNHWRGRVGVVSGLVGSRADNAAPGGSGLSVMGDYFFRPTGRNAPASGLRATGGLLVGTRSALTRAGGADAWGGGAAVPLSATAGGGYGLSATRGDPAGNADSVAVPYIGLGYSGQAAGGGLRYSADFGLMALQPAAGVRLGRAATASPPVDDLLRELRLSPVLRLGVSYSF